MSFLLPPASSTVDLVGITPWGEAVSNPPRSRQRLQTLIPGRRQGSQSPPCPYNPHHLQGSASLWVSLMQLNHSSDFRRREMALWFGLLLLPFKSCCKHVVNTYPKMVGEQLQEAESRRRKTADAVQSQAGCEIQQKSVCATGSKDLSLMEKMGNLKCHQAPGRDKVPVPTAATFGQSQVPKKHPGLIR